jgi:hypothetical protein
MAKEIFLRLCARAEPDFSVTDIRTGQPALVFTPLAVAGRAAEHRPVDSGEIKTVYIPTEGTVSAVLNALVLESEPWMARWSGKGDGFSLVDSFLLRRGKTSLDSVTPKSKIEMKDGSFLYAVERPERVCALISPEYGRRSAFHVV